jgi:hypothetical protein
VFLIGRHEEPGLARLERILDVNDPDVGVHRFAMQVLSSEPAPVGAATPSSRPGCDAQHDWLSAKRDTNNFYKNC